MINPYKRLDVFKCKSLGHSKFENRVSVYHVLHVRKCFPEGCLYFIWRCLLLNKGQKCKKGYKHVGRSCASCKQYYDEKINNQPELLIPYAEYQEFLEELDEFEDWIKSIKNKFIDIEGTITTIKPAFSKTKDRQNSQINLKGYFIHFKEAFLERIYWEDSCYAHIYPDQQERFKFGSGDKIEFRAKIELNQGRLLFKKISSVDFLERSNNSIWNRSRALVLKYSVIPFDQQLVKCLHCDQGMLIDVTDKSRNQWEHTRELICLKSFPSAANCYYKVEDKLFEETEQCPDEVFKIK